MGASWPLTLFVVFSWYASNIGVLLLNKFLLSNTGFRQPVFLTLCHMIACALMGATLSMVGFTPMKRLQSKAQLAKVFMLSIIFCATIVLGNMSLKYIPISFNQAIGATTPFFTAIFAFALQGIKEGGVTYATLIPIAAGVCIASGGEPQFHAFGFIFCLLATAGRALKSVVQAILMTDPSEKLDPMSLLLYMSGFSIVLLLPTTAMLEPTAFALAVKMVSANHGFFWWLLVNSSMAYLVNLTNFLVTKYTSALTLQVLGNAKGVIAAVISIMIFHNPVTWRGVVGYAITVFGVFLYSESKRNKWSFRPRASSGSLSDDAQSKRYAKLKGAVSASSVPSDVEAPKESTPLLKAVQNPLSLLEKSRSHTM